MARLIVAFVIFTSWPTNVIRIEFLLVHAERLEHQALSKELTQIVIVSVGSVSLSLMQNGCVCVCVRARVCVRR